MEKFLEVDIANIPASWVSASGGTGTKASRSTSKRFVDEFYGGEVRVSPHFGMYFYTYGRFVVTLTERRPFFLLGSSPDALRSVAATPYYVQPGVYPGSGGEDAIIPEPKAYDAPPRMDADDREFVPRRVRAEVGDTAKTVVLNWFVAGVRNASSCAVGITVGQKCTETKFRAEPGVVIAKTDAERAGESAAYKAAVDAWKARCDKWAEECDKRKAGEGAKVVQPPLPPPPRPARPCDAHTAVFLPQHTSDSLRMLTRPDYDDVAQLLEQPKVAEIHAALEEQHGRADDGADRFLVLASSYTGKTIVEMDARGLDPKYGEVHKHPMQNREGVRTGTMLSVRDTLLKDLRDGMLDDLKQIEMLDGLKNLGNAFVSAAPAGFPFNPSAEFTITLELGLVFGYTSVTDGLTRVTGEERAGEPPAAHPPASSSS